MSTTDVPRPPLRLDGRGGELLRSAPPGRSRLGSDPFAPVTADPLLERLQARVPTRHEGVTTTPPEPPARPPRSAGPPRARLPRLSELPPPEPGGWLDPVLGEDLRLRIAALAHLVEGGASHDAFGFSPEATRRALPAMLALYHGWFRVGATGREHLPAEGPVVLAGNHAGLLPFDAAMTVLDVLLHSDPPRLVRSVVDTWAGTLPFVNVFFARVGQVIGTRENVEDLLAREQPVLVFPEGIDGVRKRVTQRYRVQPFRTGFVELALRARAPIVPVAIVGSDDQTPILYDVKPLARWLRLPVVPITPTFPWLGPLGLLPYPVRYRIVYGEPLPYHERFGPEGADDPRLVDSLARGVRREVQRLLDRHR